MMNDTNIWLERLSSLHKCLLRKAATEEGAQLVHLEILHYLSMCNKYSNTAQAISEYLGQTKGSVSQSLKFIEEAGHIERRTCYLDGRVQRIHLTDEGKAFYKRMEKNLLPILTDDNETVETLKALLLKLQQKNNLTGFGQCKSCKYNQKINSHSFHCCLTGEPLSSSDIQKICREHIFPSDDGTRESD